MDTTFSLHIVRHYGLVGGMENYVWELTHALARKGQQIRIICEQYSGKADSAIDVIEFGRIRPKPRWFAQLRFSHKISRYVHSERLQNEILHSHERTAIHQVTTFHGPPFLARKKRVLDFLSPRIHTWTYLEKRELAAKQVKFVLPNSRLIGDQLRHFYPEAVHKIIEPAYPAVAPSFAAIKSASSGKTIGFLGREWERKGLDIAVQIVKELRSQDPAITFFVAGCNPAEIKHLFASWEEGYQLLGWVKPQDFLAKIDLLIHPARAEPFGMAIAEANAAGIPVIVSDQCGIAPLLGDRQGDVISIENQDCWIVACQKVLQKKKSVVPLCLSWDNLAAQHIALYRSLSNR
ncbi:MAG: glycosyltransferase family 4 protein [Methylococcales bacterium]